jgi:ABC-2 type transport system ATP-binding protein
MLTSRELTPHQAGVQPTGQAPRVAGNAGAEHVIETAGLRKRYPRGVEAVRGIDLQVRRGEIYGFLGPNGAGKTTTMRMLVGLIQPSAGTAVVAGHPPGHPLGLARVGSLIESPAFWPYLSGRDNLRVLARFAGVPEARIDEVLATVDLSSRARDRFGSYSMGMKQRLGVAAALLKDPELLILDEPSNGLDPQGIVEMRRLLRQIGEGGRTVMLSSHLLGEVEQICDRVGVIQSGQLVAQGTVEELRGRGGTSLLLHALPAERALGILCERLGEARVAMGGEGFFRVTAGPGEAAAINRALVQAGVDVSELRVAEATLEEIFLGLTGEVGGV